MNAIDRHMNLPVSSILAPLVQDEADIETSLQRLSEVVSDLKAEITIKF